MGIMQAELFAADRGHREAFERFHRDHPEVYTELVRLARQAVAAGRHKFGLKALWEVMRWNFWLRRGDGEFKLNNNHAPYYSRLIMAREPDLAGVFETREIRAV